jgi:C-terminal processing protease CtpA/Prc
VSKIFAAVAVCALIAVSTWRPAAAATGITVLDLIETDFSYTTISDQYQRAVAPQLLLDGARVGLIAYLRSRGIADPQVGPMHVQADGRGVVPAIDRQMALALQHYGARCDARDLMYAAIRGEVAALHDPYSVFFTATEVKGFSAFIDGAPSGGASPPDVTQRLLPDSVGYVALRSFAQDAGTKVRDALLALAKDGAKAYVFDLRGDGGGYESAAVHVASDFISDGPIVANEGRDGKRHVSTADGDAVPGLPLVVLVDHDSASGSELVAGAIQDRHAGTLVGARTFGKGVAQTMFGLPDGSALKLTTARYYTAGGRFIDHIGLEPDVAVDEPAGSEIGVPGHDPQLDRALQLLTGNS